MADLCIIFLRRKHTIHWYQSYAKSYSSTRGMLVKVDLFDGQVTLDYKYALVIGVGALHLVMVGGFFEDTCIYHYLPTISLFDDVIASQFSMYFVYKILKTLIF